MSEQGFIPTSLRSKSLVKQVIGREGGGKGRRMEEGDPICFIMDTK